MKAFPNTPFSDAGRQQDTGMDLRDYFAAKAMQGMLAHTGVLYGKNAALDDENGAKRAYRIANEMIKERKRTGE
jgi:hypothetical protein